MYVCVYVCIYVCRYVCVVYIYARVYVGVHVCLHVCTCVCLCCVCMHVCMHVCMAMTNGFECIGGKNMRTIHPNHAGVRPLPSLSQPDTLAQWSACLGRPHRLCGRGCSRVLLVVCWLTVTLLAGGLLADRDPCPGYTRRHAAPIRAHTGEGVRGVRGVM